MDTNARFLLLYTQIQSRLYAFVLAVVHNRSDADEIFQETVLILWNKFETYREGEDFGAWAIGIAKNKVFEYLRHHRKKQQVFQETFYQQLSEQASRRSDDYPERMDLLKQCVQTLREKDQALLMMRYNQNLPIRTMSEATGRSCDSLYKAMTRIMVVLRQCISRKLEISGSCDGV